MREKQLYYIFGLLLILFTSCGRTTKTEYFPNGEKKSEINYSGEKLDGASDYFYNNGHLQSHFFYKDGLLEGESQSFFFSGDTETKCLYKNGKLNGVYQIFFSDGNILKEIKHYKNDTLEGKYIAYYRNGEIKIEGSYKSNMFDSTWNYYDRYGRLVGKGIFKKGNGTLESYHKNGNISQITPYIENEIVGEEKYFNNDGKLIKTVDY